MVDRRAFLGAGLAALGVVGACAGSTPTFVDDTATTGTTATGTDGGGATTGSGGEDMSCDLSTCPAPPSGARAVCDAGACAVACQDGFGDCDGDLDEAGTNGCEVDLTTADENCGACGTACAEGCFESACNTAAQVSAGLHSVCAVRRDGSVFCWGRNVFGEVGNDQPGTPVYAPVRVPLEQPATQVAVGGTLGAQGDDSGHACALMADGTVQCWGNPQAKGVSISLGTTPVRVEGLVNAVDITAGGQHTCAIKSDAALLCWGENEFGQIGDTTATDAAIPVQVQTGVADASAGTSHTCSVTTEGALFCWGRNGSAQLGLGSGGGAEQNSPTRVALTGVEEVSAGNINTCARTSDELYCWGWNFNGGAATGGCTGVINEPQLVSVPNPVQLSARGRESGVVIAGADRHIEAWGLRPHFEDVSTAGCTVGASATAGVVQAAHSEDVTCLLFENGELQCAGEDEDGLVGDGDDPGAASKVLTTVVFPPVPQEDG